MARVLALHLDKTLAIPLEQSPTKSIARHIDYAKKLDYYCIIPKTFSGEPRAPFSPAENMDVRPTNSTNRLTCLRDFYRLACQVIEDREINVITVQDWRWLEMIGMILRRKYQVALNVQMHLPVFENPYYWSEGIKSLTGYWQALYTVPRGNTWYVGTKTEQQRLIKRGLNPDLIFQVPFSISGQKFAEADGSAVRQRVASMGFTHLSLWAGRLVPQKDLRTLLEAFAIVVQRFPTAALWLLGQGPLREPSEALARKLKIDHNVRFCGFVPYSELPQYYKAADVICISSLYEGTCRVIHEGMAAGKPILSTRVDGALDAIQDGVTGCLVPLKSPEQFAWAWLRLLENPQKAEQMGQAGQQYHRQHLGMDEHCEVFVRMWEKTAEITHQMRSSRRDKR